MGNDGVKKAIVVAVEGEVAVGVTVVNVVEEAAVVAATEEVVPVAEAEESRL